MNEKYNLAINKIVSAQQQVIGPLAVVLAKQALGLSMSDNIDNIHITGDPREVLGSVVTIYKKIFGDASVSLSMEVMSKEHLPFSRDELPSILQGLEIK